MRRRVHSEPRAEGTVGARTWRQGKTWLAGLLGAALLGLAGCHFDVSNPGPVQDKYLDDPGSFDAIVNGMGQSLANAMNYTILQGAIVTRELFPTGQTGQFGIEPQNEFGSLIPDEQGEPWSNAQQARWLEANGIARLQNVLSPEEFARSKVVGVAYLWQGFTNRLLGENMCVSVVDGGPATPSTDYLKVALDAFDHAVSIATAAGDAETAMAAIAGRAAVKLDVGDWSGAVADAGEVPTSFVFQMPYYNIGDEYQYNRIAWSSMSNPYRAHTVWNTWYQAYEDSTHDPRVPYRLTNELGSGAIQGIGRVNWWPQMKYPTQTSSINLASGREMRLIEAEARLRDGDWQGAIDGINQLRAAAGVAPVSASNAEEAWTLLKRERGIELWLEGRRLNDLRRWKAENTPGALSPLEQPGAASHLEHQDLCFPPSRSEYDTNPNLTP